MLVRMLETEQNAVKSERAITSHLQQGNSKHEHAIQELVLFVLLAGFLLCFQVDCVCQERNKPVDVCLGGTDIAYKVLKG